MYILWILLAIALVVGIIKTSLKLLKVIFFVALLGGIALFLKSIGLF